MLPYCVFESAQKNQDKLFEQRMEHLTDLALQSEVVSIACGLDLSRDVATHFLQQRLLVSQVELARRIRLPIVVREKAASDKIIEMITQAAGSR